MEHDITYYLLAATNKKKVVLNANNVPRIICIPKHSLSDLSKTIMLLKFADISGHGLYGGAHWSLE